MSILDGVDGILDRWLDVETIGKSTPNNPHHKKVGACLLVSTRMCEVLNSSFNKVKRNWRENEKEDPAKAILGSDKNWRFTHETNIGGNNKSREKILEKTFATAEPKLEDWANQVPVASGAAGSDADRKTSIDLVWRVREGYEYVFYELKVAGYTPLFAAMEVLKYGIVYLVTRQRLQQRSRDPQVDKLRTQHPLLQAKVIHLSVLAPETLYRKKSKYDLDFLVIMLNSGLRQLLGKLKMELSVDFAFETLPEDWEKRDIHSLAEEIKKRRFFRWVDPPKV